MSLNIVITGDNSNLLKSLEDAKKGVRQAARDIERSGLGIEGVFKRVGESAEDAEARIDAAIRNLSKIKDADLVKPIRKFIEEIRKLSDEKIDFSNPSQGLQKFDEQVIRLCNNLDSYFDSLKSKLEDLLSVMGGGQNMADNVPANESNIAKIEQIKRENAELQKQIREQTKELERQQEQWRQLAEAVRSNNVSAVQKLSQETDDATKRIKLDSLKGSLKMLTGEMDAFADKMSEAEADVEILKAKLESLREQGAGSEQIEQVEIMYGKALEKLEGMKTEYNMMSEQEKTYISQLQAANGHHVRMRTQIMNAREEMIRMINAGQKNTPMFQSLAKEAGKMRKEMALASAYMEYYSTPNSHLVALKEGLQGVAGATGVVTGVIGIFNEKSERMQEIQTKMQSIIGVIIGLETTYSAVKQTSNLMIAVSEFQTWALARAKKAEAQATVIATIKQKAYNLVAKSNPYVLLASVIGLLVLGIYELVKANNEAKKSEEERQKQIEKTRKAEEHRLQTIGKHTGDLVSKYMLLQHQWKLLRTEAEKQKWLDTNIGKFKELTNGVKSVTDAQKYLVELAPQVITALKATAEANAYESLYEEALKKRIQNWENRVKSGATGDKYKRARVGDRITAEERRAAGLTGRDYRLIQTISNTTGTVSTTDNGLTQSGVDKINLYRLKEAQKLNKKLKAEYDKDVDNYEKGWEDAIEKAQKAQSELGKYAPGSTTPDDKGISKEESKRQKYLALLDKQKKERERAARDLELSTAQAEIDAMEEGSEKTARQIELDFLKKDVEIERAFEDLKDKKIEAARKLWEANPDNEGKLFDESSVNIAYTDEEIENFIKQLEANRADYNRNVKEFNDEHDSNMRKFLQEYGDELQQELALTEEYSEKIAKARADGDEGTALMLEKKLQEAISNSKLSNLKNSAEFVRAFEDLSAASSETLKSLIDKFEKAKEAAAKNLDPQQLREYSDTLQQMYDELENRDPFATLAKSLKELAKAQKEVKDAQDIYDSVKAGKVVVNKETGNPYTEAEAIAKLTEAKDKEAKIYSRLTKAAVTCADKLKTLSGVLSSLGEQIGGSFGESLGAIGNILSSAGDAFSSIKNFDVNAKGFSKVIGQFSAVGGTVSAMMGMNKALSSLLPNEHSLYEKYAERQREINELHRQMLELELEQLKDRLDKESWFYENGLTLLKKNAEVNAENVKLYAEAAAAPQEIYKNKQAGLKKAAGAIIGAVVGVVLGAVTFGAGSGVGAAIGTAIGTALGSTAVGAALGAGTIAAIGTAIFSGVGGAVGQIMQAGLDQLVYNSNQTAARNNLRVQTRHATWFRSEKTQDLESWVRENYKQELFEKVKMGKDEVELIDPEVAKKLLEDGPKLVGETKETVEKLLEYSEAIHEFIEQVHDYVSEAFAPLVDNLTDALFDWLTNGKNVMDSFRKYASDTFKNIAQDALKAMIANNIFEPFQDQLEEITLQYGMGLIDEKGYMSAVSEFAKQAQTSIETQLPMLEQAAEAMKTAMQNAGIDITGSEHEQEASTKGFKAMGQDTADEINGRFTALQIAGESIATQVISIYDQMVAMAAVHAESNTTLQEIRNLMITNNNYLDDVAKYSKKIYAEFSSKLEEVVNNVKRI